MNDESQRRLNPPHTHIVHQKIEEQIWIFTTVCFEPSIIRCVFRLAIVGENVETLASEVKNLQSDHSIKRINICHTAKTQY